MSTSILIKNGIIINATPGNHLTTSDILVIDGKIKAIAPRIDAVDANTKTIDATGLLILPGGIDPHVHMQLPIGGGQFTTNDFASGSQAALAGGTTTFFDFVTPTRTESLYDAAQTRIKESTQSNCHTYLHMGVTTWNSQTFSDMRKCVETYGMRSVKVYMAYKQTIGLNDDDILRVMDAAAKLGIIVMVHCEHGESITYLQDKFISQGKTQPLYHALSRPPEVEAEAVRRAIMMSKFTGSKLYIVHVSTEDALIEIEKAKHSGQTVIAETCPHYLLLDDSEYQRPGFDSAAYVMSPPLRPKKHRDALWKAINKGIISIVSTDHCPFNIHGQKDKGLNNFTKIPNGVPGVEHRMSLLYRYGILENKINLHQFVDITSTQPAKIFGLYPQKGIIAPGSDADIVLWNPGTTGTISYKTHLHKCDNSIYEGFPIQGKAQMVLLSP